MNIAFYTGSSGLKYHQQGMDVLSNNMANVSTFGYKAQRASFSDQLYDNMTLYALENEGQDLKAGHGVRLSSVDTLFEQGPIMSTDNPMDYAIVGEGLFGVVSSTGDKKYTRAGNFVISMEGKKPYLKTTQGDYVTDVKGKKIIIPYNDDNSINFGKLTSTIGIFQFPNKYGLAPVGGNTYMQTETSGKAIPADGKKAERPNIMQSYIEGSGVDLSNQMTDMILAQKAFQFSAKVVQVADEMEQVVNSLR